MNLTQLFDLSLHRPARRGRRWSSKAATYTFGEIDARSNRVAHSCSRAA